MNSALTCVPHLRLDCLQLVRQCNEFVDDLIDSLRNRVNACERLIVRFGEINLVAVNCLISGQSSDREDLFASRRNIEFGYSYTKRAFSARADVVDKSLGRYAEHCAGSPRRARMDRLGFFENLFDCIRHLFVWRKAFAIRPNKLAVYEQKNLSAANATSKAELFRVVERREIQKPDRFSSTREGIQRAVFDEKPVGLLLLQNGEGVRNHFGSAVGALD